MNKSKFPKKVGIMGIPYTIEYCTNPSNVDIHKRESLWGQIDFWTKTIRIYGADCDESIWQTIWHEIIHGIMFHLKIRIEEDKEEDLVDLLALGINDIISKYFVFKGNVTNEFLQKAEKDTKKQKKKVSQKNKRKK